MEKAQLVVHYHQEKDPNPHKLAKGDHVNKPLNSKLATNNSGNYSVTSTSNNKRVIWDCGSTLYDSFELNSFQKQLDSAIISSSRTLSMPRLPSDIHPLKKPVASKFYRSFRKLLRSVFQAPRPNRNSKPNYDNSTSSSSPDPWFLDPQAQTEKPNGLSTSTPEVPEVAFSPEIGSLVRKTVSDRFTFTATSVGIYCA